MSIAAVNLNMTEVVEAIRDMENRLADLKKMIQSGEGKKKRVRDPNAPKREANDWIKFTQKVEAALKGEGLMFKRVADSKKFAASLKTKKAYTEWTEAEIVVARKGWEPAAAAAAAVGAAAVPSSATATLPPDEEVASDADAAAKKRGRKPMTDEQKAVAKAARDAKKASA